MNSIKVHQVFIAMGLIIVISFLGSTFFRKTRIPNSILLILIGIVLNFWKSPFDVEILRSFAPAFGSFALLLILLEAGLELDLRHFFKTILPASLFGISSYILGVSIITWILNAYFNYSMLNSLLLGLVCVGCSPSILMPILDGMSLEKSQKTFLDLECNVTEVFGLIITLSCIPFLFPVMNGTPVELSTLLYASALKLFKTGIIALIVPVILGMIWSRLLSYAGERPLWPVLTIGITLLLFGATESLGSKGALNVLVFGLVVGNARIIRAFFVRLFAKLGFHEKKGNLLSFFVGEHFAKVHHISRELSFFVRTFFFVYLGAIVDFRKFNIDIIIVSCILTFVPMLSRLVLALSLFRWKKFNLPSTNLLFFLTPRGLANALIVFATIDYAHRIFMSSENLSILRETLITPVFGVIILSNLVLTFFLIFRDESQLLPQPLAIKRSRKI